MTLSSDYALRHPRSRDTERAVAIEAKVLALRERGVPMGDTPHTGVGHNWKDAPYPLICLCPVPVPEWVYVAHQCATCKRVIKETP